MIPSGVVLTTNGVKTQIHGIKTDPQDGEDDPQDGEDDVNNHIQMLSPEYREEDEDEDQDEEDDDEEDDDEEDIEHIAWAVDPGRSNIIFALGFNSRTGELVATRKLTRRQYYEDSGINRANKIFQSWNDSMQDILNGMSEHSLDTVDADVFFENLNWLLDHHDQIWLAKAVSKKWYKLKFFLYGSKRKFIHNFLISFQDVEDGPDGPSRVYYGNGSFPSGRKGETYVPCKWIKKLFNQYFWCSSVNEFRTSQVCPFCNERLCKISKQLSNKKVEIRGLRWCESCTKNRFWDRDEVGCRNIYRKGISEDYPDILNRPRQDPDDDTLVIGVQWPQPQSVYVLNSPLNY